jgi:hypothetical protein
MINTSTQYICGICGADAAAVSYIVEIDGTYDTDGAIYVCKKHTRCNLSDGRRTRRCLTELHDAVLDYAAQIGGECDLLVDYMDACKSHPELGSFPGNLYDALEPLDFSVWWEHISGKGDYDYDTGKYLGSY